MGQPVAIGSHRFRTPDGPSGPSHAKPEIDSQDLLQHKASPHPHFSPIQIPPPRSLFPHRVLPSVDLSIQRIPPLIPKSHRFLTSPYSVTFGSTRRTRQVEIVSISEQGTTSADQTPKIVQP